ncbi:cilia- and flagella-associated protein 144 isoform X1 [Pongo pygmaeus]|uniref:cilia- and flagella-associated protein 144 isoform X1 n=1 Tax=Pongo pygmaeus TaxID=9600 RepID=UPI0023E1789C|nr:cilia- and flagella-associated protein 144 isoform X1 [Pongo pygmaeus]
MAGHPREKVIPDEVHQNQILRELYLKELRTQKLYTQYHVNPLRKIHTVTMKPMSWHDNLEEPADDEYSVAQRSDATQQASSSTDSKAQVHSIVRLPLSSGDLIGQKNYGAANPSGVGSHTYFNIQRFDLTSYNLAPHSLLCYTG